MSNNKFFDEFIEKRTNARDAHKSLLENGVSSISSDYWDNAGSAVNVLFNQQEPEPEPFYPPKGLGVPVQGLGAISGPVTGTKITIPRPPKGYKAPEKIKADILERLTGQVANLCTKYNLSDKVDMETEVTMVEINGTTTVTLTATINWLPNPFVFVAMESFQEPPF